MIGILSKSELEETTDAVISWILYQKGQFRRFNGNELESLVECFNHTLNGEEPHLLDALTIIWARRWNNGGWNDRGSSGKLPCPAQMEINRHLKVEQGRVSKFFFDLLSDREWLSDPNRGNLNKLIVLREAKQLGIPIPETALCSTKTALKAFVAQHKRVISKCISDSPRVKTAAHFSSLRTIRVDEELIESLPERFFPSLVQKEVEKAFEIRTFYLDGKLYSMAIFSQQNEKTELDFRNYDFDHPNRRTPYRLSPELEKKLKALMQKLDLNTGSIDLIKGVDDQFYFLEINPVGQFGMVSGPCNYYLEKEVATYLMKNDQNNRNRRK